MPDIEEAKVLLKKIDYLVELYDLRDDVEAIRESVLGSGYYMEVHIVMTCNRLDANINKMIKKEQDQYKMTREL